MVNEIRAQLRRFADPAVARGSQRFFKTGPGEYGAGDRFLGIRVPQVRKLVALFPDATLATVSELLESPWHEERLFALFLLIAKYERSGTETRARIARLYLAKRRYVNNWDLVDSSAHLILGPHLQTRGSPPAGPSGALGQSLGATHRDADDAVLHPAERLRRCPAHRGAAGRRSGRPDPQGRGLDAARNRQSRSRPWRTALPRQCTPAHMPRTMLRYAIEKFPADERARYLAAGSRRAT